MHCTIAVLFECACKLCRHVLAPLLSAAAANFFVTTHLGSLSGAKAVVHVHIVQVMYLKGLHLEFKPLDTATLRVCWLLIYQIVTMTSSVHVHVHVLQLCTCMSIMYILNRSLVGLFSIEATKPLKPAYCQIFQQQHTSVSQTVKTNHEHYWTRCYAHTCILSTCFNVTCMWLSSYHHEHTCCHIIGQVNQYLNTDIISLSVSKY